MALLKIPEKNQKIKSKSSIEEYLLTKCHVLYEQWNPRNNVDINAPSEMILQAYRQEIDALKKRGGYVTADVVQLNPDTPGLDAMLAKFNREHWHEEDEVRFIIYGHGLFHIHPKESPVVGIQVEAGDLICLPRGTLHWFDLCEDKKIRTIRLFQDPTGWTPYYSESGVDKKFQPVCMGLSYFPPQPAQR